MAIILLILLAFQYELGMVVNLSDPQPGPPVPFSNAAVSAALARLGTPALLHGGLGGLIFVLALVTLILSLATRVRLAQVFGGLAFLSIAFAGIGGTQFVLSGFQNDHATHNMATNFLLSFAFYFIELYVLKPPANGAPAK